MDDGDSRLSEVVQMQVRFEDNYGGVLGRARIAVEYYLS